MLYYARPLDNRYLNFLASLEELFFENFSYMGNNVAV